MFEVPLFTLAVNQHRVLQRDADAPEAIVLRCEVFRHGHLHASIVTDDLLVVRTLSSVFLHRKLAASTQVSGVN
jgi:hypothetical protein